MCRNSALRMRWRWVWGPGWRPKSLIWCQKGSLHLLPTSRRARAFCRHVKRLCAGTICTHEGWGGWNTSRVGDRPESSRADAWGWVCVEWDCEVGGEEVVFRANTTRLATVRRLSTEERESAQSRSTLVSFLGSLFISHPSHLSPYATTEVYISSSPRPRCLTNTSAFGCAALTLGSASLPPHPSLLTTESP